MIGHTPARVTRLAAAAAALALGTLLAGCATSSGGESASPAVTATTNPFSAGGLQDPADAAATAAPAAEAPVRVRIDALGVDSALEQLTVDAGGRLEAPADYDTAGWFRDGVRPGDVGPAIIAGHVDSPTAPAVFARIAELHAGDEIVVTASDGADRTFRVSGSVQTAKSQFPTAEVYRNVPAPELRLITCAGAFDTSIGHYTDNLVVFATAVG